MEALVDGDEFRHVTFVGGISTLNSARPRVEADRTQSSSALDEPRAHRSDHSWVDPFLIWLLERGGLNAADYRPAPLARRLPACLRALRVHRTEDARAVLERRPELLPVALGAALIGVTSFFRDSDVFELLEHLVLPRLLLERRALACWSAGCSDGAELYSVAIMLVKVGALQRCVLHGTDCRPGAIAKARVGEYRANELVAIAPGTREVFFAAHGERGAVRPALRQAVSWSVGDVLKATDKETWDLILCRNLAIYLQAAAAAKLWANLYAALRPGGIMVVGKAEHPSDRKCWKKVAGGVFQKVSLAEHRPGMDFIGESGQESGRLKAVPLPC